ncbi:hypothetical protein BC941DRAFT_438032 [Chlamydoabsidia padenii]|nr:hypothetical protein BC941DRAFT_438032 [Chlamydoabsidia padenii]
MMDVHIPLTPPEEQQHEEHETQKPTVKFNLGNITTEANNKDHPSLQEQQQEELPSPSIDINAHMVPDSILVALLDREQEMKGLVHHNLPFFQSIQQHLGPDQWIEFEKVLYCSRQQLSDKQWMIKIEDLLDQVPCMVGTFKELVGYVDDDTSQDNANDYPFLNHVDLCHIRRYPERLHAFKSSYPQFFINCQHTLSKEAMSILESTLFAPTGQLSDNQWKATIKKYLSPHPNLMDQLKEIIAYEVDDE